MGSQNVNDVALTSAPNSPRSSSSLNDLVYYYSAPTSPKRIDHASFEVEKEVDSELKDFEFETSRKFIHLVDGFEVEKGEDFEYPTLCQLDHCSETVPTMAFADELFSNGQVAPLKLPPCLHGDKEIRNGYLSSTASSPKSPSSVLRLSFSRKSLWNDEFDPFKTAMDNVVRDEKRGRSEESTCRRARSQSPLRNQEIEPQQENGLSPYNLSKPKGLGIAKQLRPLQVCHETATEKNSNAVCKTQSARKMSSGEKRVAGEMKSIVQYRPKLFLCLGLGGKPSRK